MARMSGWMRAVLIAGATLTTAACMSYPSEPRYSTRATPAPGQMGGAYPAPQGQGQMQGGYPAPAQTQPYSPPSPMATAPVGQIDGGALPPPAAAPYTSNPPAYTPPPSATTSRWPPASPAPPPSA